VIARRSLLAALALSAGMAGHAQVPPLSFVDPSTTGIPGELISEVSVSPGGHVWVGARWLTPAAGGLGILKTADRTWTTFPQRASALPSQFINDVAFATDGTAWMGVGGGLVRFDVTADEWQVYDAGNSPLEIGNIRDVAVASDDTVWLIDSDTNVAGDAVWRFDGQNWTDFRVGAGLPSEWESPFIDLDNIAIDADDHVWVTHSNLAGVAEYDGSTWTLHGGDIVDFDRLVFASSGNLWLREDPVGGAPGFWKFDGTDFEFFSVLNGAGDIAADENGVVYFADINGNLFRTDDGGATITTFLSGLNGIVEIAVDPDSSDVWLGTIGAVGHFRADGTLVRDYNTYNTGVPWWAIENFHTDEFGRVWMLNNTAGASVLEPDGEWRNWSQRNAGAEVYPFGDTTPTVEDVVLDDNDQWWMVSNSGTASSPDLSDWTLFEGGAREIAKTPDGRIWRGGAGFLEFFEADSWNDFDGLCPLCDVKQLSVDAAGALWVISRLAVHRIVDDSLTTFVEGTDIPIDPNTTYDSVAADPVAGVWIGSSNGLVRFDGTQFSVFDESNSGIVNQRVDDVAVRDDGLVAAAGFVFGLSQGGVSLFDGQDFTNITPQNSNLPTVQSFALHFAPDGDLLIATGGLFGVTLVDLQPGSVIFTDRFESETATNALSDGTRTHVAPGQ
jgi:hypothetical protein